MSYGQYENMHNRNRCDNKIHAVMIASDKGMKLIAGFSILVESSGNCQQSAGSFDQLDSQWNITQCVHEQVRLSS